MSNETVDMNQLLRITQNTAMSVNEQSKQMGLILGTVEELKQDVGSIKQEVEVLKSETTVTRAQAARIKKAIHSRVAYVLKLEYDGGRVGDRWIGKDKRYRGAFLTRAWVDAKYRSKCGDPYYTTLKADFAEVMDYIDAWEPEVKGGVEGYKHYLDIRHKESVQ